MSEFYQGKRFRLMAVSTSGVPEMLDTGDLESAEAKTFIGSKTGDGQSVQVFVSEWKESVLPFTFYHGHA